MKLWTIYFTYEDHEMESEVFAHRDTPSTDDARRYLLTAYTDDGGTGYMQDALENLDLLTVDGVHPFTTAHDIQGNPYRVEVAS